MHQESLFFLINNKHNECFWFCNTPALCLSIYIGMLIILPIFFLVKKKTYHHNA